MARGAACRLGTIVRCDAMLLIVCGTNVQERVLVGFNYSTHPPLFFDPCRLQGHTCAECITDVRPHLGSSKSALRLTSLVLPSTSLLESLFQDSSTYST